MVKIEKVNDDIDKKKVSVKLEKKWKLSVFFNIYPKNKCVIFNFSSLRQPINDINKQNVSIQRYIFLDSEFIQQMNHSLIVNHPLATNKHM